VLVDDQQVITRKYGMVNVPTAVWIDERGRIVRPNEVAFIDDRFKSFTNMDSAPYVDAISRLGQKRREECVHLERK